MLKIIKLEKKNIFIPDTNTRHNQVIINKKDCPISGCITRNNKIGISTNKLKN